jgi:tetratricopeptide (TPR) repeat protein
VPAAREWSATIPRRRLSRVFAELFLPNLLAFACGQGAAWYYLRTGRFWLGVIATVALWSLLDWWMVARYVFLADEVALRLPATLLQATALVVSAVLAFGLWRRRWSAVARARREHFEAGLTQYLRSDYAMARATFVRLVRTDPWDAAAWIALGDVCGRTGHAGRAQRCYRRAGAVDTQKEYADLLQQRRLAARAG